MKYWEADFHPTPCSDDVCDILAALLGEQAGFESFERSRTGLRAYVQQTLFSAAQLEETLAQFPLPDVIIDYSLQEAEDKDWNETWEKEGFEPVRIGQRIYVHDVHWPADPNVDFDLIIHPKEAFGTGCHPTTQMILSQLLDTPLDGANVLDAGCGTGILSIMAARRGARWGLAYDIDEWSVENTRKNLALNGIETVEVRWGDAGVLAESGTFDVVMANINRNILLHDLPTFARVMAPHSRLIVSGFYASDSDVLTATAQTLGLQLEQTRQTDDWTLLVFVR